jgi:3-oxoacyl-[acyl-carrier-protein] synthase II
MGNKNNRRVVITGMGGVTPIGQTLSEIWDSIIHCKSGAATITSFDTSKLDTKFACQLKNFNPVNYIDKKTSRRLDPYAQYALAAAALAIKDCGIDSANLSESERARIGVIFGSGIGGIQTFYQQSVINYSEGPGGYRLSLFCAYPRYCAGYISIQYGFRPNLIVSACNIK